MLQKYVVFLNWCKSTEKSDIAGILTLKRSIKTNNLKVEI
jgi:hypothetical protein